VCSWCRGRPAPGAPSAPPPTYPLPRNRSFERAAARAGPRRQGVWDAEAEGYEEDYIEEEEDVAAGGLPQGAAAASAAPRAPAKPAPAGAPGVAGPAEEWEVRPAVRGRDDGGRRPLPS
jgi:hypothetical protein